MSREMVDENEEDFFFISRGGIRFSAPFKGWREELSKIILPEGMKNA